MALLIPGAGLVDATDTLLIPGVGLVEQAATGYTLSIDTAGALTLAGQSAAATLDVAITAGAITLAGQQVVVSGLGVNVFPWVRLAHVEPRDRLDSVDERDRVESVPPRRLSSPLTA
jgi:hypothetical protein